MLLFATYEGVSSKAKPTKTGSQNELHARRISLRKLCLCVPVCVRACVYVYVRVCLYVCVWERESLSQSAMILTYLWGAATTIGASVTGAAFPLTLKGTNPLRKKAKNMTGRRKCLWRVRRQPEKGQKRHKRHKVISDGQLRIECLSLHAIKGLKLQAKSARFTHPKEAFSDLDLESWYVQSAKWSTQKAQWYLMIEIFCDQNADFGFDCWVGNKTNPN